MSSWPLRTGSESNPQDLGIQNFLGARLSWQIFVGEIDWFYITTYRMAAGDDPIQLRIKSCILKRQCGKKWVRILCVCVVRHTRIYEFAFQRDVECAILPAIGTGAVHIYLLLCAIRITCGVYVVAAGCEENIKVYVCVFCCKPDLMGSLSGNEITREMFFVQSGWRRAFDLHWEMRVPHQDIEKKCGRRLTREILNWKWNLPCWSLVFRKLFPCESHAADIEFPDAELFVLLLYIYPD